VFGASRRCIRILRALNQVIKMPLQASIFICDIICAEILADASLWRFAPMHTHPACLESGHKNALASKHFYL
ncbi:MAG: hypothetical protein J6C39_00310, partial [Clostridia bacterium]|nr:hypothetical protein [Clostridia bacterium]